MTEYALFKNLVLLRVRWGLLVGVRVVVRQKEDRRTFVQDMRQ